MVPTDGGVTATLKVAGVDVWPAASVMVIVAESVATPLYVWLCSVRAPAAGAENSVAADPSPQFTSTVNGAVAWLWMKLPNSNECDCPATAACAPAGVITIVGEPACAGAR